MAYQATQHTGKTGEHYITNTRKEYINMFWSAAGGGIVIAFLCLFKMYLASVPASNFGTAVYYSLNYAIGFLVIYFLGFTVATKQPAMTAAALARSLADSKGAFATTMSLQGFCTALPLAVCGFLWKCTRCLSGGSASCAGRFPSFPGAILYLRTKRQKCLPILIL